jgi:hypothetical protein
VQTSPDPTCPCRQPQPPTPMTLGQLYRLGWRPGREFRIVSWCGHGRNYTPWPEAGWTRWQWVPFYGDVRASVLRPLYQV